MPITGSGNGPRAVLWDLDGTLIDSRDQHWRAWRDTMEAEGAPITESDFDAAFGQRNADFLGRWLGDRAPAGDVERVAEAKEARYRELLSGEGVRALPGAVQWLRVLHETGWRQAVASSAPRRNVELALELLGVAGFIHAVVTSEDVDEGKPAPDVFLEAADRVGVRPSLCVVVEDAEAGIEAARRGGFPCVGIGVAGGAMTVGSPAELPRDAFEYLTGSMA